ncbi:hypothetical protein SSCI18S_04881 [Sphingobium scionense]
MALSKRCLPANLSAPITAAAIAREAGVGRNVLYVGHTDILQEIRTAADARTAVRGKRDDAARADALKVRDLEGRLRIHGDGKCQPTFARP